MRTTSLLIRLGFFDRLLDALHALADFPGLGGGDNLGDVAGFVAGRDAAHCVAPPWHHRAWI